MNQAVLLILIGFLLGGSLYFSQSQNAESLTLDQSRYQMYKQWRQQYKETDSYQMMNDEGYRFYIWLETLEHIEKFQRERKDATYELGLNQFSDLSDEEFSQLYLQQKTPEQIQRDKEVDEYYAQRSLPDNASNDMINIDWSRYGAVGRVQNQRKCNAGYAFASVDNVQSYHYLRSGEMRYLSQQQVIDCYNTSVANQTACAGGSASEALNYISKNGLFESYQYPFTGKTGLCLVNELLEDYQPLKAINKVNKIPTGQNNVCENVEIQIQKNPIVVRIDASNPNLKSYKGGVYSECGTLLTHDLLLTGLLKINQNDGYWTLKNSWGKDWGEQGFLRISYGDVCGICNEAYTGSYE